METSCFPVANDITIMSIVRRQPMSFLPAGRSPAVTLGRRMVHTRRRLMVLPVAVGSLGARMLPVVGFAVGPLMFSRIMLASMVAAARAIGQSA